MTGASKVRGVKMSKVKNISEFGGGRVSMSATSRGAYGCCACFAVTTTSALLVVALLLLAGGAPALWVHQAAFRLGAAAQGPCDLPTGILEDLLPDPPTGTKWRFPSHTARSSQCGRCHLKLHVPDWLVHKRLLPKQARHVAARHAGTNHSGGGVCVASAFHSAALHGLRPEESVIDTAAARPTSRYRAWAEAMGPQPFVVSLVRPPPPAEPLPQRGRCPLVRQMHAFRCPLTELRTATVGPRELHATGFGGRRDPVPPASNSRPGGAAAALAQPGREVRQRAALLVEWFARSRTSIRDGSGRKYDGNIYHRLRMARDASAVWCACGALLSTHQGCLPRAVHPH